MALRNQPYIPLYVQDYLTDEKLNECSLETQGFYIKLMCILHKSNEYGVILLKQKDKHNKNNALNFAVKISKQLPFQYEIIERCLLELIDENVLLIEDDKLLQRRMVKDNALSEARAKSGSKGGKQTQSSKDFAKAKNKATSEDESESESEDEVINKYEIEFEKTRYKYPGTKRGLETEFVNFKKKHKDWKIILPDLYGLLEKQIETRELSTGFVPQWANFSTWINQRKFEEILKITTNEKSDSKSNSRIDKIKGLGSNAE